MKSFPINNTAPANDKNSSVINTIDINTAENTNNIYDEYINLFLDPDEDINDIY